MARRVGRARQGSKATRKARQGVRYAALEDLDGDGPETMQRTPADGETIGEVMFRGNIVMKGYLKNRKASDEPSPAAGFHSGDLGVMHPDGYIQLKDRSKDIIISGGENISSIEVEDALYKHPPSPPAALSRGPTTSGARCGGLCRAEAGQDRDRGRNHRPLPRVARPLQGAEGGDFRRNPQTRPARSRNFRLREMAKGV